MLGDLVAGAYHAAAASEHGAVFGAGRRLRPGPRARPAPEAKTARPPVSVTVVHRPGEARLNSDAVCNPAWRAGGERLAQWC